MAGSLGGRGVGVACSVDTGELIDPDSTPPPVNRRVRLSRTKVVHPALSRYIVPVGMEAGPYEVSEIHSDVLKDWVDDPSLLVGKYDFIVSARSTKNGGVHVIFKFRSVDLDYEPKDGDPFRIRVTNGFVSFDRVKRRAA